jgi:hypothetical protein
MQEVTESKLTLETNSAKHRPTLNGLERNRGLGPAFGAICGGLRASLRDASLALRPAFLAMPRDVLEPFRVKVELLTSRKHELRTTVDALQISINEIHDRPANRQLAFVF